MSAANHKYDFDKTTLTLVRKVILLRGDFIGIPSRLTRPPLTPYVTFSVLTPYNSSTTRDPQCFLVDLSSFISSTFCMTTLVQTIPSCEIVIVLSVTLKSRVCICTLIRDGVHTPYRLLCGANNHTLRTTLCIHYTCGKLKLSCELCWKLAERAPCPETLTSCLQFNSLCWHFVSSHLQVWAPMDSWPFCSPSLDWLTPCSLVFTHDDLDLANTFISKNVS